MISAIVYTSNSGYTAEYARLLGRATGLPVNDLRQVHTPQPDEEVIFLGWLMADRVMGWPKANAFFKVRAVCQVGMGPASAAAAAAHLRAVKTELVVAFALFGVAEDLIGLVELLEALFGVFVVGVQVGVVLFAFLTVGFFDRLIVGTGGDAQNTVWIGHFCFPSLCLRIGAYLLHTPE